jgi:hypothetical protein
MRLNCSVTLGHDGGSLSRVIRTLDATIGANEPMNISVLMAA